MSVAAIVLAAGASRRLGHPKQLLQCGGETLVQRAARIAAEAGLSPVFVVVPSDTEVIAAAESPAVRCIVNHDAEEGMASSIRCGVQASEEAGVSGAVILACDQPALDMEHLRSLVEEAESITASAYRNTRGIPAYFPAAYFGELRKLQGDVGARELLRDARLVANELLAFDVDTPEDAARLRQ